MDRPFGLWDGDCWAFSFFWHEVRKERLGEFKEKVKFGDM